MSDGGAELALRRLSALKGPRESKQSGFPVSRSPICESRSPQYDDVM